MAGARCSPHPGIPGTETGTGRASGVSILPRPAPAAWLVPVEKLRSFISILAAVSYTGCAGFHAWAADEAAKVIGTALPGSLPYSADLTAVAFQPWVLVPYLDYHGNSIGFLIAMEAVSAAILAAVLLLVRRIKSLHTLLVVLTLLACPFLAWAAVRNHESAWRYDHLPPAS